MLTPDPSQSPVQSRGAGESHKSNGQQRRDRACHKSKALYRGARGSERVTNQTNSVGSMAVETNHCDPISSAACPSLSGGGERRRVAADIKKTE